MHYLFFAAHPIWLIQGTTSYLKETGDFSILDEMVPFDNDMSTAKTLFDHLTVSFQPCSEPPWAAWPAADWPCRLE